MNVYVRVPRGKEVCHQSWLDRYDNTVAYADGLCYTVLCSNAREMTEVLGLNVVETNAGTQLVSDLQCTRKAGETISKCQSAIAP